MMVRAQPHLFVCLLAVLYAQPLTAADGVRNISLAAFRYSALKIIQQDGLPVRKPQADWEVARAKVQADPAWQSWVENHRKSLDIWISKPRDRAELEAGWGFDLINPANGALVKWTSEMPEPTEHSAYSVKYKQAWASWNRSYNIGKLLEAARMYRLTGEVRYANWATSQLDFYANNYSAWPLRQWNGKARMMGQSLDEATAVVSLIEAVNLLSGYVGAQKKELWRQKLFNPIVGNLRDFNQGVNNIALWHAVAIALVGFQYHDTALISEALDGPKGVGELMKKGVTNDDLWYEGSFAYNAYVVRALTPLLTQGAMYGYWDRLIPYAIQGQNLLLAPIQFRFDDGALPTSGDSMSHLKAFDLGLFLDTYRVSPTRIGLIEATRVKSWDTLLDPVAIPELDAQPLPPVVSSNFEATRMAVLKTNNWQLFMHYGQLTQAHAQQEALNYELYLGSTPVSIDQGTVAYGSPLHQSYFRRGVAHNVPLVDGIGQNGWAPGNVVSFDKNTPAIEVVQPTYWSNATASRRLEISNETVVDNVSIKLNSATQGNRRLGLVFNSECKIDLDDKALGKSTPSSTPVGQGFEYWRNVTQRAAPRQWSAHLGCADARVRLTVNGSAPQQLFHATAPATPLPARRESIYIELMGREATFEMRLQPES